MFVSPTHMSWPLPSCYPSPFSYRSHPFVGPILQDTMELVRFSFLRTYSGIWCILAVNTYFPCVFVFLPVISHLNSFSSRLPACPNQCHLYLFIFWYLRILLALQLLKTPIDSCLPLSHVFAWSLLSLVIFLFHIVALGLLSCPLKHHLRRKWRCTLFVNKSHSRTTILFLHSCLKLIPISASNSMQSKVGNGRRGGGVFMVGWDVHNYMAISTQTGNQHTYVSRRIQGRGW